jgi:hypothetical protein
MNDITGILAFHGSHPPSAFQNEMANVDHQRLMDKIFVFVASDDLSQRKLFGAGVS